MTGPTRFSLPLAPAAEALRRGNGENHAGFAVFAMMRGTCGPSEFLKGYGSVCHLRAAQ
jgi:hypothetical protein